MNDRVRAILAMLESSPKDVFLHYSLGMEYAAAGLHEEAVAKFKECIAIDQGYVPAYVEAGKSLRHVGKLNDAREVFSTAMHIADAQGEKHITDYIKQQLESIPKGQ